jgi:hypothetical protein
MWEARMGFCSFIEKRCNRFYFRMRLPVDIADLIDRSHVVASLQTGDLRLAKQRSARLFLLLATYTETMRLRMAQTLNIDVDDPNQTEALALQAFALGQVYEAKKTLLHREFMAELRQIIATSRGIAPMPHAPLPPAIQSAAHYRSLGTGFGNVSAGATIAASPGLGQPARRVPCRQTGPQRQNGVELQPDFRCLAGPD